MTRSHVAPLVLAALLALAACGTRTGADEPGSGSEPTDAPAVAAPTGVPAADGPVTGLGTVIDQGDGEGPQLCLGPVAESYPPQCSGLPVQGWDWKAVEGFDRVGTVRFGVYAVTGTFDGTAFTLTEEPILGALYDPMPTRDPSEEFASRCPEPDGGWTVVDEAKVGDRAMEELYAAAAGLPGYAGIWVDPTSIPDGAVEPDPGTSSPETSGNQVVNVLVTEDVEGATDALRDVWGGPLCVTLTERTEAELQEIATEVIELPGVSGASPVLDRVRVDVLHDDGSLQAYADATYGEGVVDVVPALRPASGG